MCFTYNSLKKAIGGGKDDIPVCGEERVTPSGRVSHYSSRIFKLMGARTRLVLSLNAWVHAWQGLGEAAEGQRAWFSLLDRF